MVKAPFYKVYIGTDSRRDITDFVESFTYEDSVEEDNLLKIVVYSGQRADDLADDPDLITGAILTFQFGYLGGQQSQLHRARITDLDPTFASKTTLTLTCLDLGTKVKKVTGGTIWEGKTSTQIAKEIADKYSLELEADDTSKVWDAIPQGNQSDLNFLKYLAARESGGNYIAYIRNNTLYFVKRGTDVASLLTVTFGDGNSGIMNFKPKIKESSQDPAGNKTKLSYVNALDAEAKETSIDSTTEDDTGTLGTIKRTYDENGTQIAGDTDNEVATKVSIPVEDDEEAKNIANNMKKKATLGGMTGTLSMEGNPLITPNNVITILGIPKRYAGNWFIEKASHKMSSGAGYIMTLGLKKNGTKQKLSQNAPLATDTNDSVGSEEGIDKEVKLRVFNQDGDFTGFSSDNKNAAKNR